MMFFTRKFFPKRYFCNGYWTRRTINYTKDISSFRLISLDAINRTITIASEDRTIVLEV